MMLSRRSFLKGLISAGVVAAIPTSFTIARSVLYPIKSIRGIAPNYDDIIALTLEQRMPELIDNLYMTSPVFNLPRRKQP